MSTFDIRAVVRGIIADTSLASPREIAAKAVEAVPDAHLRPALEEALVDMAGKEVSLARMAPVRQAERWAATPGRSAKVAAIRAAAETWREALHTRIRGVGEWKLLADCTYDDLMFASDKRHEMARRNAARAAWYAGLAAMLRSHGAGRVAELPDDDLRRHIEASTDDDDASDEDAT